MKNLIITTGFSKVILTRFLPTLRTKGEYQGDVVVLDYDVLSYSNRVTVGGAKFAEELSKEPNVTVVKPVQKLRNIFLDRLVASREYLLDNDRYKQYDTVMLIDGNDTVFWGPIQSLLDKAKKKLCVAQESHFNLLRIWDDFYLRDFIKEQFWSISENPIINGGMIVGPSLNILEYLDYEMDMMQAYGDVVSDQCYLVLLIYFYKYPALIVGDEWNYTHAVIGRSGDTMQFIKSRVPIIREGKAYKEEDGTTPVYIEHRTGTGYYFFTSRQGLEVLRSNTPIPINAEYDYVPDPPQRSRLIFPRL